MPHEVSEQAATQLQVALAEVIDGLHAELDRLRLAVDQLRVEMRFVVGTRPPSSNRRPPLCITSLPKDPAAADFFDRINAVPFDQIAAMRAEVTRSAQHQTYGRTA